MKVSDMGTRRSDFGLVSANKKLFAIGGSDGENCLKSVEMFDPVINLWRNVWFTQIKYEKIK